MIGGLVRDLAKGVGELVVAPLTATNAIKDGLEREGKKLIDGDEEPDPRAGSARTWRPRRTPE